MRRIDEFSGLDGMNAGLTQQWLLTTDCSTPWRQRQETLSHPRPCRCITPVRWPCRAPRIHRLAGGVPLSASTWSSHRLRGRPVGVSCRSHHRGPLSGRWLVIIKSPLAIAENYVLVMFFCLSVRLFVCLSPVKFVKSFARWQHLATSGGLSCRLRYSCYCC